MEKHTCKLCFRRFSNGRALGGHMRSHVIASGKVQLSSASSASSSAADEAASPPEDSKSMLGLSYVLRENPKRSFRLVDPEFSSLVQDRESETESPHRRCPNPKRPCHIPPPPLADAEPASSVSDAATAEEDVAFSLMMLSRDFWGRPNWETEQNGDDEEENESHAWAEEPKEGAGPITTTAAVRSRRSKYQCGTCKKVFKSYQALGGHRASHKKSKGGCSPPQIQTAEFSDTNADLGTGKIHECPFCLRVFTSGQALGGHKRSHLISSSTTTAPPKTFGLIDLNLPAPIDDDFELSAVSDAEFVADFKEKEKLS